MNAATTNDPKVIYWHRELPPLGAEPIAEHVLEANSRRIPGTIAHRDELWDLCHEQLMAEARRRLLQEMKRLDGDYVHVLTESITPRHDDVAGEAWLHGQFCTSCTGPDRRRLSSLCRDRMDDSGRLRIFRRGARNPAVRVAPVASPTPQLRPLYRVGSSEQWRLARFARIHPPLGLPK